MKMTLEKLINNDSEILEYYQNANKLWEKIWNSKESENEKDLAKIISSYQYDFEEKCGGRWIGQEIMAWSAYAYLLKTTDNFPDTKLKKLNNAFKNSFLSSEIYAEIDNAKKALYLDEE
ncbi:hypothetical protein [Staphylococcus nepalensis]|uniref:hypothetical protein n=1 Tax=Staphylococcus nepalensis TaxID=214473 RepID=UPI0031BA5F76